MLTNEQLLKLYKCMPEYDPDRQILKVIEELSELIQAITKYNIEYSNQWYLNIIEEVADVYIVLEELMVLSGIENDVIKEQIQYKLDRFYNRTFKND